MRTVKRKVRAADGLSGEVEQRFKADRVESV